MSKVFGISMAKNEEDIIGFVIEHLLQEDLDGIIIADNLSSDNTRSILEDIAKKNNNITILDDLEPAYYQSEKMTNLAHYAATLGAEWIIPFDSDEVWYSTTGKTLGNTLRSMKEDIAVAKVFDHYPHPSEVNDINPIKSIIHKEINPERFPCVAFRYDESIKISLGNHNVMKNGERNYTDVEIRHFQYRSFEQFKRKLRNGKQVLDLTTLSEEEGAHWRTMGAMDDESLLSEWQKLLTVGVIIDPAPTKS